MNVLKILNDDEISDEELNSFNHRRAVRVVIFDLEEKVALVHAKIRKYYELPGGGVEEGEALEEGVIREAKEEAGCDIKIRGEIGIVKEYLRDKNLINETFCYTANTVGNKNKLNLNKDEVEEGMEIIWVDIKEAIKLIKTNNNISKHATFQQVKYTRVRDLTFLEEFIK